VVDTNTEPKSVLVKQLAAFCARDCIGGQLDRVSHTGTATSLAVSFCTNQNQLVALIGGTKHRAATLHKFGYYINHKAGDDLLIVLKDSQGRMKMIYGLR
jgi:hypothetical protein